MALQGVVAYGGIYDGTTVLERDGRTYGMLGLEILRALQEKNPEIRDWNSLDPTVRLVLPEVHEVTSGGADFYTIQVGAFRASILEHAVPDVNHHFLPAARAGEGHARARLRGRRAATEYDSRFGTIYVAAVARDCSLA